MTIERNDMAKAKRKVARKRTARKPTAAQPKQAPVIDGGTITLDIQGGEHDGKTIRMDAYLLKIVCERLEQSHHLEVKDGKYQATVPFIQDLDKEIRAMGYPSTPAIAAAAWRAVNARFIELQKKTSG